MPSRCNASDIHAVTVGIYAFFPSCNQGFYPGIEEIMLRVRSHERIACFTSASNTCPLQAIFVLNKLLFSSRIIDVVIVVYCSGI